ncbi:MAG: hypothetical protein QOI78_6578, partial [Actinomycetota bacterium]|nr:hypothetical protein [Actinomycetota bacterium]
MSSSKFRPTGGPSTVSVIAVPTLPSRVTAHSVGLAGYGAEPVGQRRVAVHQMRSDRGQWRQQTGHIVVSESRSDPVGAFSGRGVEIVQGADLTRQLPQHRRVPSRPIGDGTITRASITLGVDARLPRRLPARRRPQPQEPSFRGLP